MLEANERQPGMSRRERTKDETRERIATAAMELFLEHGFAATTVDEIAQRADVAKGTFFNHFPRKEAVLFHYALAELDRLEELIEAALANGRPAREQLGHVFAAAAAGYERNPELSRVLILEMVRGPEAELFEIYQRGQAAMRRLVVHAQQRGEFRREADPDRVTDVLRGLFISTMLVWLHCPTLFDLQREIASRLSLVLDGLMVAGV